MSTHQILPAVPKRSTTSYATTGDGGFVPERTQDAKERRELKARVTAPSPTEALIDRNIAAYRQRVAADEADESRRLEEMKERIRRDEQRLNELKERKERLKSFRAAEKLVDIALDALTPAERSRCYEKLTAENRVHDVEHAMYLAQVEVASRTAAPVEQVAGTEVDWRRSIKTKK
jgi:hypothetical protein